MIERYSLVVEEQMRLFYSQLPEKEQRRYAALESEKFGYGGKAYIIRLLGIHHRPLNRGIEELRNPDLYNLLPSHRQRKAGGGRKKKEMNTPIFKNNSKS